ncbi:MAG: tryptophan-rich sensory protein [Ignavibacteriales bacterium]
MGDQTSGTVKIVVLVTFLAMLAVNALADIIPINGVTTGQVSNAYPNLFAPAGITFAIWGLIYVLLAAYTLYQLGYFQGDQNLVKHKLLNKVGITFSISSLANAAWIFAWHYDFIPLSMLLMIVILICLIYIAQMIKKEQLSFKESLFIGLPFSIYFGWITVATIANAAVLLVSLGWKGFGIAEPIWAIIMIAVGMLIGAAVILKHKDIAYGMVLVWAYAGIYIKHTSSQGFAGQYPQVITTVLICVMILLAAMMYVVRMKQKASD